MERESFEDEATAADLNASFVAIKVDREERPDLDAVYMDAVQAMTGQGGWPMSVFLTPDGRPFYGGTYFPDQPRHGMPSFRQVLAAHRRRLARRSAPSVRGRRRPASPSTSAHGQDALRPASLEALADQPAVDAGRAAASAPSRRCDPRSTPATAAGAARPSSRSR